MKDSGYFDQNQLSKLIEQHSKGIRDNSSILWTLLMFESFLRQRVGA
jgi:asparagine synthase (glutamine-hydrolysing)